MYFEDLQKSITGGKVVYSMKTKEEFLEFLETYHIEGYKLAAGYCGSSKLYYVTLLK